MINIKNIILGVFTLLIIVCLGFVSYYYYGFHKTQHSLSLLRNAGMETAISNDCRNWTDQESSFIDYIKQIYFPDISYGDFSFLAIPIDGNKMNSSMVVMDYNPFDILVAYNGVSAAYIMNKKDILISIGHGNPTAETIKGNITAVNLKEKPDGMNRHAFMNFVAMGMNIDSTANLVRTDDDLSLTVMRENDGLVMFCKSHEKCTFIDTVKEERVEDANAVDVAYKTINIAEIKETIDKACSILIDDKEKIFSQMKRFRRVSNACYGGINPYLLEEAYGPRIQDCEEYQSNIRPHLQSE